MASLLPRKPLLDWHIITRRVKIRFLGEDEQDVQYNKRNMVWNYYDRKLQHKEKQCNKVTPTKKSAAGSWETLSSKSNHNLFGPASCIKTRQMIYPCESSMCFILCPCFHCKGDHDELASMSRFQIYSHHKLYHHARHLKCEFCSNLFECLPNFSYTANFWAGYNRQDNYPCPSYEFKDHSVTERASKSKRFKCEDCDMVFTKASNKYKH